MDTITIKELAKRLNLSKGTVSKALKDSYEISAETKKRVLEMAVTLNYIPNPYASSLRRKKSKTIGVVIPEVADSFFSLAINGIESVARSKGYHVLIYLTHESYCRERDIINEFKSGRVDGTLISVSSETIDDRHFSELQSTGVPVIFFDRVLEEMNASKITTNDFESGYIAAEHLIKRGCKKIAFISLSYSLSICNKRIGGYEKALSDNNLPQNILLCSNDEEYNSTAIKELLNGTQIPDGIIISVERLIMPVYQALHELKIAIPHDCKILAFSNLPSAFILNPSLTTITQPAFETGVAAATLLFKAIEKRDFIPGSENLVIPSILNTRNSTADL